VERFEKDSLTSSDKVIIKHILHCYFWLQTALLESKISMKRILSMFAFKKTESKKNLVPSSPPSEDQIVSPPEDNKASNENAPEESDPLKKKAQKTRGTLDI